MEKFLIFTFMNPECFIDFQNMGMPILLCMFESWNAFWLAVDWLQDQKPVVMMLGFLSPCYLCFASAQLEQIHVALAISIFCLAIHGCLEFWMSGFVDV